MAYHLKRYVDRKGEHRWTLYAANGRKVATCGEGYTHRAHCERMVRRLFPWFFWRNAR